MNIQSFLWILSTMLHPCFHNSPSFYAGLVPRTFGIAPEKALKMQAWVIVGRWVDRHVENPTIMKWLLAGAAAGAATTIIGTYVQFFLREGVVYVCVCVSVCV